MPAGARGETAVIDVELLIVNRVAALVPKLTRVALLNAVPVIVTLAVKPAAAVVANATTSIGTNLPSLAVSESSTTSYWPGPAS